MYVLITSAALLLVIAVLLFAWHRARNLETWERVLSVGVVAALAVAATTVVAVWHRAHYHEWPYSDSPSYFEWCGRTFKRSETNLRAPATLYRAFTFEPLLASHHEVFAEHQPGKPEDGVCAMVLWMRVGSAYRLFELQGGP